LPRTAISMSILPLLPRQIWLPVPRPTIAERAAMPAA
jgi:hypothetical protein